jgi:hypothetical protein
MSACLTSTAVQLLTAVGLQDGCPPLIYASYCGKADVVRVLIEKKGARLEAGDQVRTHTHTHTHKS